MSTSRRSRSTCTRRSDEHRIGDGRSPRKQGPPAPALRRFEPCARSPGDVAATLEDARRRSAASASSRSRKIRRRVRDGLRLTDHIPEYQAKRKTLRRRLDALERAEAERDGAPAAGRAGGKQARRPRRDPRPRIAGRAARSRKSASGAPGRAGRSALNVSCFRQNATAECVPAMSRRATSRSSRTRERRASDRRRRRGRGPQGSVRDPTPTYTALEVRIEDVQAASRPLVGASREATARTGVAVILMERAASCSASSWKLLQRSP
jgi:hypothetical protein